VIVRLLYGELVIEAPGDSLAMRGPAQYLRPCALEWPVETIRFTPSVASRDPLLSLAGASVGERD